MNSWELAKQVLHHVTDSAFLIPGGQVQASTNNLSSLVQLLHGDVGFVQSAVMFTLATLALHAYNRGQIIEAGAIGRIVQLLKSHTQDIQLSAATTLSSLSREPNIQALFLSREGGAIASLTRLLKSSSVKVQGAAVSTLAINIDGKVAIVAAGAIPLLVHLLKSKAPVLQLVSSLTWSHCCQSARSVCSTWRQQPWAS